MKVGRKNVYDTKIKPFLPQIAAWRRNGVQEKKIIQALDVSIDAFYRYKKTKKELYDTLLYSKELADLEVENAVFKKATGRIILTETKTEITALPDGSKQEKTTETKKETPPDTKAAIFWLKHRKKSKWNDIDTDSDATNEELLKLVAEVIMGENDDK